MTLAEFRSNLKEKEETTSEKTDDHSSLTRPPKDACKRQKDDVDGEKVRNRILNESGKNHNSPIVISEERIIGDIDLSGVTVTRKLKLEDKLICGRLILQKAVLQAGASFRGTTILAMEDDARFGALVAHGLTALESVDMAGLKAGAILMKNAKVENAIRLGDTVFGGLDLHNAQGTSLVISYARQSNRLALDVVEVLRSLPAQETADDWLGGHPHQFIRGVVRLSDLQLDGQLRGEHFVSEGVTILNDARVHEARFRLAEFGALDMRGFNVTTDIRLYSAILGKGLPENSGGQSCAPREVPFFDFDIVDLSDAHIGRHLFLDVWSGENGKASRASDSLATLCMDRVQVVGNLTLSGMKAEMLSLRSSSIGGELAFRSVGTHHFSATELDLSNSSANTFHVSSATRLPPASRFNDLAVRNVIVDNGISGLKTALMSLSRGIGSRPMTLSRRAMQHRTRRRPRSTWRCCANMPSPKPDRFGPSRSDIWSGRLAGTDCGPSVHSFGCSLLQSSVPGWHGVLPSPGPFSRAGSWCSRPTRRQGVGGSILTPCFSASTA